MRRSLRFSSIALAVAICTASSVAFGGYVFGEGVSVSSTSASGTVGTARYSGDSKEQIGCQTDASAGSSQYAYCWASNSAGNYVSCVTSDANLVAVAGRVSSMSTVVFYVNANGTCSSIYAENGSEFIH